MTAFVVVLLPALLVGQSVAFFRSVLPGDNPDDFYPVTNTHRFLASHLGNDRYDAAANTMYPATSLYYGLRTATGHQWNAEAWGDLLKTIEPNSHGPGFYYAFTGALTPNRAGQSHILDQMGVRYFVFEPGQLAGAVTAPPVHSSVTLSSRGVATCTLPGGPLRGVSFVVRAPVTAEKNADIIAHVSLQAGATRIDSARFLAAKVPAGALVNIAVAGEDLPASQPITMRLWWSGVSGPITLGTDGSQLACAPVRPLPDGLKLVYADAGSIIYQRLTALPRIRWASRDVVVTNSTAQINALQSGLAPDTVLLDQPGPSAAGQPAKVTVLNDVGGAIDVSVEANGTGYLVVADAMQVPGWSVTIDGSKASLVPANHAMVAVPVPAGDHIVRFRYHPPLQKLGFGITIGSLVVVISVLLFSSRNPPRHGRRPRPATMPAAIRGDDAASGYPRQGDPPTHPSA